MLFPGLCVEEPRTKNIEFYGIILICRRLGMKFILQCSNPDCNERYKVNANTKLKTCVGCQCAKYCDSKCQDNHWKSHKLFCKTSLSRSIGDASYSRINSYRSLKKTFMFIPDITFTKAYLMISDNNNNYLALSVDCKNKSFKTRCLYSHSTHKTAFDFGFLQKQLKTMKNCTRCVFIRLTDVIIQMVFCNCSSLDGVFCPAGTNTRKGEINVYYYQVLRF
jgi:hypothetical protein